MTDNPTHADLVEIGREEAALLAEGNAPLNPQSVGQTIDRLASFIDSQASRIEDLEVALRFYRDGFAFKTNKKYGGLEWSPTEALLDDCGNTARAALGGKP